jgi:hypothetical protein
VPFLPCPQNFVRPLRFSLALALAPVFERVILWISARTGLPKQVSGGEGFIEAV